MKNIKVIYEDGDEVLTRINGTEAEIRAYYIGRVFNLGSIRDKLVKAVDVVFLDKETLEAGDRVTVHIYDGCAFPEQRREIQTRNAGKIYTVKSKAGKMGIDWNDTKSPYTSKGDEFVPFEGFANCVGFEDVESGVMFHWDNIAGAITVLEQGG